MGRLNMEFGHLSGAQLAGVNFTLPPEPDWNNKVLPGTRAAHPQVYVGAPRWGVKEWVGNLYPQGTKDAQYLAEYIKQFNCIELNSTFYNVYPPHAVAKWKEKATGHAFKFCPKVFQGITHEGTLDDKDTLTTAYLESVVTFEENLGPVFMQLSDNFSPQYKNELIDYLQTLPTDIDWFLELRHPAWFNSTALQELLPILHTYNKGLVITDVAGRRDCCHMRLSIRKAFVRFNAYEGDNNNERRIKNWVQRIQRWLQNGLEELYFMIHLHNEVGTSELATQFIDELNNACGLQLKPPQPVQPSLF